MQTKQLNNNERKVKETKFKMKNTNTQNTKFDVIAELMVPITIQFEAHNEEEAMQIAQQELDSLLIDRVKLELHMTGNKIIRPITYDAEIKIEDVDKA